jgi:hypothetical protein
MTDEEFARRMTRDFRDFLVELADARVDFLVVGGHAVARHGAVRATLDIDVLVRPSAENAPRVVAALAKFGAPLKGHGVTAADFARTGTVYQMGLPPSRIDVLTSIAGVPFEDAWATRVESALDGRRIPFIGKDALIRNKRAAGRPKDLLDVDRLEGR